jgi:hypothetical protein
MPGSAIYSVAQDEVRELTTGICRSTNSRRFAAMVKCFESLTICQSPGGRKIVRAMHQAVRRQQVVHQIKEQQCRASNGF